MFGFLKNKQKIVINDNNTNMNTITINGKSYQTTGSDIRVVRDKVYVDGKLVVENLEGIVKIEFTGDLASLECNTAEVHGNIQGKVKCNTITCGDVGGDVDANTVKCGNVSGKIDANTVKTR